MFAGQGHRQIILRFTSSFVSLRATLINHSCIKGIYAALGYALDENHRK